MKILVAAVILIFGAFTGYSGSRHGYWSAFPPFNELPTLQIFFDLCVSLSIVIVGMYYDWRARGKPRFGFAPFVLLTVLFGSFGPLFYLLFRTKPADPRAP